MWVSVPGNLSECELNAECDNNFDFEIFTPFNNVRTIYGTIPLNWFYHETKEAQC